MKKRLILGVAALLSFAAFGWPPFIGGPNAEEVLALDYSDYETGVKRLPNGVYEVRALTPMPDVTPEMVLWWFADYMQTSEHYIRWHPKAHLWMDWENKRPSEIVGASHLVHEYIGPDLQKLRIQFVDPQEILGSNVSIPDGMVVLCARAGLLEYPIYAANLCHVIRETEYGTEMRSRFWMGKVGKRKDNERVGSIIGLLGNTYLARKVGIPKKDAESLMIHCIEEMRTLSGFLPKLYETETQAVSEIPQRTITTNGTGQSNE